MKGMRFPGNGMSLKELVLGMKDELVRDRKQA
jgi:hypothetical protein